MILDGVSNAFSGSAWFVVQARDIHGDIQIHPPPRDMSPVEAATLELARTVHAQWRDEASARDLFNPAPLAVVWRADHGHAADHEETTGSAVTTGNQDITALATAFRELPHQRVVLLGNAGSGKTTLATLLVLELLAHWTPDDPVPVLFSLESWNPSAMHFRTWLAGRLVADYPNLRAAYGDVVVRQQVRDRRVLPVLDGLDEMPAHLRASALLALNRTLTDKDPIIVTSRTYEYTAAVEAADVLRAAVILRARPVEPEAAAGYLRAAVPPMRLSRWQVVFDRLATADDPLAAALSTPLMVWLARVVYASPSAAPADLADAERFPSTEAIENHLLDALIPAVFTDAPVPADLPRSTPRWRADKPQRWLSFVADHLTRRGTENLSWWQLHRAPIARTLSVLISALVLWLLFVSMVWLVEWYRYVAAGGDIPTTTAIAFFLVAGVLVGIVCGVLTESLGRFLFGLRPGIPTGRITRPAFGQAARNLGHMLRLWPVRLVLAAGVVWLTVPDTSTAALGTFGWMPIVFGPAAAAILRGALMFPTEPAASISPDRLLDGERTGVLLSIGIAGLINGVAIGVLLGESAGLGYLISSVVGGWFGSATVIALRSAWVRWLVARFSLAISGRLPWSAMTFLRDARRRGVLRQTAGVYQFRHARLRQRLTRATPPAAPPPSTIRWDGDELRIRGRTRPTKVKLRSAFPLYGLVLDGIVLAVTVAVGFGTIEVLAIDGIYAVCVGVAFGCYFLLVPKRPAELRITSNVIEGGTEKHWFRCDRADISELTVRPTHTRRGWRTKYYSIQVRLRPGAPPPSPRIRRDPDGWIPLWTTGITPEIPSALASALSLLAGQSWKPNTEARSEPR